MFKVKFRNYKLILMLILVVFIVLMTVFVFVNPIGMLMTASGSQMETEISLPDNLAYTFNELKTDNYELYDEFYVTGIDENGKKSNFLRSYYLNSYTGEEIVKSQRADNGQFHKGYYNSNYCRCTYFKNGTMTLTGKKIGKVYNFDKGELKNVSSLSSYNGIFSDVYILTYYNSQGKRIGVKTFSSNTNDNFKNKFYEKYYNSVMLPVSEKRFNKLIS